MVILLTGFEPFGGEKINPSWETVSRLPDGMDGAEIIKRCLPVSYKKAEKMIDEEIADLHPDAVLSIGQAGGRSGIALERIAINLDDASIADNDGVFCQDLPIKIKGPAAYFSTLPLRDMLKTLTDLQIRSFISNSAGTFICNHIFYTALDVIQTRKLNCAAGFIHVPYLPEQCSEKSDMPSMELSEMVRSLKACIEVLISFLRKC